MYLLGCFLQFGFTLAYGLSNTGAQLIVFRGFAGIASSFCLPSAVSLINETFAPGRRRNVAFASMGGGQPVGFGLGLTLGGAVSDTIGWRWGFYIAAMVSILVLCSSWWQLPRSKQNLTNDAWHRLRHYIDWVGGLIASCSLAMLSYALA